MVSTFAGFWSADPSVMRRLRAMAALDGEIEAGVRGRDARRVHIARDILKRTNLATRRDAEQTQAAGVLGVLTSFEAYDALARGGQTDDQIVATLRRLAQSVLTPFVSPQPGERSHVKKRARRKSRA